MVGKIEERRQALREKLVDAAEKRVAEGGSHTVKARDLAADASCAVGAIYTVVSDLGEIILAVNGRTFRRLGAAVEQDLQAHAADDPTAQLIAIAHAYLDFAIAHRNLWHSLFDIEQSPGLAVPDWYWAELDQLFAHIAGPVAACFPALSEAEQALMTRALFSSVHGIVLRGLENPMTPTPRAELSQMITLVLTHLT